MKLRRVALEAFRKFRQPAALDDLQDGLNILAGPNEAGKSTYAAAIRAAFLERYRTSTVTDFAPHGVPGARPGVELAFEHGGHGYVLRKYFLARPRCELVVDGGAQRFEGEEAENALAALLGFDLPVRGQSRPEHAGVPGLLWIEQGQGQDVLQPAAHAAQHVREALTQLTGELAAHDGDRLYERVAAERAELLDARSGRPKGAWREAEEAHARAGQEVADLAAQMARLEADVDRLDRLRTEYERARADAPWVALEARAAQARERLDQVAQAREALARLQQEQEQAEGTLALLHEQAARDQRDAEALAALQRQADETIAAAARFEDEVARLRAAAQAAALRAGRARQDVARVRAAAARRDLDEQIGHLLGELARLAESQAQADGVAQRMQAVQAERVAHETDPAILKTLRAAEQRLAALRAQQQAVATRIRLALAPGMQATLDGTPLPADGAALLTQAAELRIAGVGAVHIEPGGKDLPALMAELAACQDERDASLRRLSVASLDEAEARARRYERSGHDLEALGRELEIHAPQGRDALRTRHDETAFRLQALRERRAALQREEGADPSGSGVPAAPPDPAAAEFAVQEAETAARQADAALSAAQGRLDAQRGQAALLQRQLQALRAEAADPERQTLRDARAARLAQAGAARDALQGRVVQARDALARQQPELAEQDLRRFQRSAQLEREAQQARHTELLQLQGRLEQAGALGLGERLAQARADLERLARRRVEFARRAAALELLWRLLGERRAAATQRLLEPLARRLDHYLALLLPQARLRLDEALLPAALRRGDGEDALAALSFGTREQLGVLARLAYADLLREAGRPTLLILDDALVHADPTRRDLMKRALFDAASRHQILLFTCNGPAWTDMGVPVRALA